MSAVRLLHCSDLHFGQDVDLRQAAALAELATALRPDAVVVAGDLTQRARHGEFQAARALLERFAAAAPLLVVPGNHDVQWWASVLHARGTAPLLDKYRRWIAPLMGGAVTPVLRVPGLVVVGTLSAHGIATGSLTTRLRDLAVKGHLPASETDRAAAEFATAPPGTARVLVLHHNVLRGRLSRRMGLARPEAAWRRLEACGADVVLCGHDHEEAAAATPGGLPVATSSTHTSRTRGGRPSACNVVTVEPGAPRARVGIVPWAWDAVRGTFLPAGDGWWSAPSVG
ncbi:MAG: metallophosphoesterase [Gemmatimonadales bacterium]|nr:metallophosphoesterase [Gemmatimonadales bacterium]